MKSRQYLMTTLIGIAMLATPVAAAARDHGRAQDHNSRPAAVRSFNAPARSFSSVTAPRNFAYRNPAQFRTFNSAPRVFAPQPIVNPRLTPIYTYQPNRSFAPVWNNSFVPAAVIPVGHGHHYGWRHNGNGVVCDEDGDDCRPAYSGQYSGYNAATPYGAPVANYASYGSCARAQVLQNQYLKDQRTGHPAAAAHLLQQIARLRNVGCTAAAPLGGGLFGGGYQGANAYNNYGGYNGGGYPGVNAYNNYGGYNASNYNSGYSGGMLGQLTPMLQQFVHP